MLDTASLAGTFLQLDFGRSCLRKSSFNVAEPEVLRNLFLMARNSLIQLPVRKIRSPVLDRLL